MPVQASSGGSTGGVIGQRPSHRPQDGRHAHSPQLVVEGRIRPQRRNSGSPQAQAAGPRRPLHRTTPGRGESVGEGRSHPYGLRSTQGVEVNRGQERVRETHQLSHSPLRRRFGLGNATKASPPPHHASGNFGGGGVPVAPVTSAAHTWEGLAVAGEGTPVAVRGTTAPQTGGFTGNVGDGAAAIAAGAAAVKASRFAGSVPSRVRLPRTTPVRFSH